MPILKRYPFYLRSTVILFGLILCSYALANLREILIPLSFSLFLAILLNPLVTRMEKWRIPKIAAITLSLFLAILFILGIWYFLATQMMHFKDQLPLLQKRSAELLEKTQHWITEKFHIPQDKQDQELKEAQAGLKHMLTGFLGTVAGTLTTATLLPVYTFLLLFYKDLLVNFIYEIFADGDEKEVSVVLQQGKGAIQQYMFGLLVEALIVAALNTVALLILGVPYAFLLGVLGALLNVLPFIGGIIAILLPVIVATITKDGFNTQLAIVIAYLIIQFTDNHFLIPYIVSSKVKINALISIVVVLLGGAVWGISGMFLSIPFIGILKIIFDRVPELRPWGKLLGDEIPVRRPGRRRRATIKKAGLS